MAINETFNTYLASILNEMTKTDSFTEKQFKQLEDLFDKFGLTTEEVSQVMAKSNVAQTQYINQFAVQGALELIKEEKQQELIDKQIEKVDKEIALLDKQIIQAQNQAELIVAQKALIDRQEEGYDDNLIVKAGEFQGGLASFAVNADSTSAQDAIDSFLATVNQMKARAGAGVVPNFKIGEVTATTIEIDWFEIENVTAYTVYVDAEQVWTGTDLGYVATGLTTATSYEITVTATLNGIEGGSEISKEVTTL